MSTIQISRQNFLTVFLLLIIGYYAFVLRVAVLDLLFLSVGLYALAYVLGMAVRWFDDAYDMEQESWDFWNWERAVKVLFIVVTIIIGSFLVLFGIDYLGWYFYDTFSTESWFYGLYIIVACVGTCLIYVGFDAFKTLKDGFVIYHNAKLRRFLGDEQYEKLIEEAERFGKRLVPPTDES